jgi:hypothetical protein
MTTETITFAQETRDAPIASRARATVVVNAPAAGGLWFGGWLFTIGFAHLGFLGVLAR